jgi:hypothetical protein
VYTTPHSVSASTTWTSGYSPPHPKGTRDRERDRENDAESEAERHKHRDKNIDRDSKGALARLNETN